MSVTERNAAAMPAWLVIALQGNVPGLRRVAGRDGAAVRRAGTRHHRLGAEQRHRVRHPRRRALRHHRRRLPPRRPLHRAHRPRPLPDHHRRPGERRHQRGGARLHAGQRHRGGRRRGHPRRLGRGGQRGVRTGFHRVPRARRWRAGSSMPAAPARPVRPLEPGEAQARGATVRAQARAGGGAEAQAAPGVDVGPVGVHRCDGWRCRAASSRRRIPACGSAASSTPMAAR